LKFTSDFAQNKFWPSWSGYDRDLTYTARNDALRQTHQITK